MSLDSASASASAFAPFFLLVPSTKTTVNKTLILLPSPLAISHPAYRALYSSLHASPIFCTMAFAHHFAPRTWSDAETKDSIQSRDIERCWQPRGLGDFALGALSPSASLQLESSGAGRLLQKSESGVGNAACIVDGAEYEELLAAKGEKFWDGLGIEWLGYAGVRDATTTSMPMELYGEDEAAALPPWQEMVELRYGIAPEFWGKGGAGVAAEAVMLWAVEERGVRRFIAETEKTNVRSGRVLEKMGFSLSGTEYWKEESEVEWERVVR